jgi:hypothetical protein
MASYPNLNPEEQEAVDQSLTGDTPWDHEHRQLPFHQYLIAVGALGEKPGDKISRLLHDTGMQFTHQAGLDPILCVGYVSESAHPADYLSAAKVWHTHLSELDHESLKNALPKFYVALSLLFGTKR